MNKDNEKKDYKLQVLITEQERQKYIEAATENGFRGSLSAYVRWVMNKELKSQK